MCLMGCMKSCDSAAFLHAPMHFVLNDMLSFHLLCLRYLSPCDALIKLSVVSFQRPMLLSLPKFVVRATAFLLSVVACIELNPTRGGDFRSLYPPHSFYAVLVPCVPN